MAEAANGLLSRVCAELGAYTMRGAQTGRESAESFKLWLHLNAIMWHNIRVTPSAAAAHIGATGYARNKWSLSHESHPLAVTAAWVQQD